MGFVVDRTNSRKEEPKRDPGPSHVSLTPLDDDVFTNNHGMSKKSKVYNGSQYLEHHFWSEPKTSANQESSDQLVKWKTLALAMGFCVLMLTVIIAVLLSRNTTLAVPALVALDDDQPSETPVDDAPPKNKLNFIQRMAWGAQPPNKLAPRLEHPVKYVIISDTATVPCSTQSECIYRVRLAQIFDIESRNWNDIGCNFMIGGDGYVYVGRGWDTVGEGSDDYDSISIGITFIGTFKNVEPSSVQLKAAQKLIEFGMDEGKIDPDYRLLGLRQISRNRNPGRELYNIIKKCPHWSREP